MNMLGNGDSKYGDIATFARMQKVMKEVKSMGELVLSFDEKPEDKAKGQPGYVELDRVSIGESDLSGTATASAACVVGKNPMYEMRASTQKDGILKKEYAYGEMTRQGNENVEPGANQVRKEVYTITDVDDAMTRTVYKNKDTGELQFFEQNMFAF